MINLKCRTEYSFRKAFGKVSDVIACIDEDTLGICDTGTWGHTVFAKACKDAGKRPIFGVEIPFVIDTSFQKKQEVNDMSFLAKNNSGLEEIYGLVSKSAKQNNRLAYEDLFDISDDVIILSGSKPEWGLLPAMKKETLFVEVNPASFKRDTKFQMVATSDNYFPKEENRQAYELVGWLK
jgi:DNA polymerase III alpha subunit